MNIRQDVLKECRKGVIMIANSFHKKIICGSPDLITPMSSDPAEKDLMIDEKVRKSSSRKKYQISLFFYFFQNVHQQNNLIVPSAVLDVFDALIGSIFLDSNYSLRIVWDVFNYLFGQHFGSLNNINHD